MERLKYFYNVTGDRARELLFLYGSRGEFLIRPSESSPIDHTLSVHRGNRVTHVKIPCNQNVHKLPTGEEFSTLDDLVYFLVNTPDHLVERDRTFIYLTQPVDVPNCEQIINLGRDRFYHHSISGLEAEELLKEELNGTYLVRESTSKGGEYAISVKNEDSVLHVRICYTDGRFRVVPKDSFRTMSDLLDNYIRIPMVQFDGTAVRLRTPLFSTRFTAACVDERIACLQKATAEATGKDGIVEEYENLHKEKDTRLFISCKEGRKPDNVRKNRYKNVVPYDHTRIKLKTDNSSSSDYINANLIEILSEDPKYAEFSGLSMKYISTQGCLQNTTEDFWRMVWQENSRVIVMVTKETERGRVKCCRYWPNLNEEQTFGISSAFLVKNIQEEEFDDYIFRTFVLNKDLPDAAPRKIYHFQFTSWEDNGSPSDSVLAFLEEVNHWSEGLPAVAGPTVVHCSAGIGRTGTFIVLDILIRQIKRYGPSCVIDIPKTVRMVREQRATMVQTIEQYRFIYHAIAAYMRMRREESFDERGGHITSKEGSVSSVPTTPTVKLSVNGNASPSELYHNLTPSPTSSTSPGLAASTSSGTGADNSAPTSPLMADEPFRLAPPPLPKKRQQTLTRTPPVAPPTPATAPVNSQ